VWADGAGAASRRALGTAVFGGMLAATLLAVFIVPVLYVVVRRWAERSASPSVEPLPAAPGVSQ
jgi:Cu/Ag efflux pump CusA